MDAFTIASWPVGSRATLYRVAWDSNYRDVVRFEDEAEREAYFNSLDGDSIEIDKMTYLKPNEPIRINIPFSACYNYNYIVVENPKLPVPGEITPPKLFYFVNGVAFDAPNTTIITVQLDVFQTYLFDFELGQCFLERGHMPMQLFSQYVSYTSDSIDFEWDSVRKYLLAPEGLDIGNEYLIGWSQHYDLSREDPLDDTWEPKEYDGWAIMVMSTTDMLQPWGTVDDPSLHTAKGGQVDTLVSGCDILIFWTYEAYMEFAEEVKSHPWISSGIISITAVPKLMLREAKEEHLLGEGGYNGKVPDDVYINAYSLDSDYTLYKSEYSFIKEMRKILPGRCKNFFKFYTFPYSYIEISALNGCTLLLKPELMNTESVELRVESCCAPGNSRLAFYPYKYGTTDTSDRTYHYMTTIGSHYDHPYDHGYNLDTAIWFDNFPQFSIVNDGYLMYLAGTVHTREYQYNAAGWAQSRGMMQAMNTFNNAEMQYGTAAANQRRNMLANTYAGYVGGVTGLGNAILGASPGGLVNTIGNVFTAYSNADTQNKNFLASLETSRIVNNANMNLAEDVIQGDYENAIAGINATVQDAALTQPSMSGANGGNGFNISNGYFGYDIRFKLPNERYLNIVANYWGRYGYAYHQYVKPPKNLKCMRHFTYWKMKDTYITSARADETAKNTLRAIFERGVTVWSDASEIGLVDPLDNWESLEV